jgi:hypothetical protein
MNLYLVLTIALGAVTGVPSVAPAARAVTPVVSAARAHRAIAVSVTGSRSPIAVTSLPGDEQPTTGDRHVDAPLTGAATPRAPAQIG